jgi:hypothetical protein
LWAVCCSTTEAVIVLVAVCCNTKLPVIDWGQCAAEPQQLL